MTDIKPVALLPCCGYDNTSAVYWNPYNKVCQCHNCGHVYTPILPESALTQAREEGRREGMREAEKYICEAIVATQDGCDGTMRCDVADLLRLFNERKAITRASEGK